MRVVECAFDEDDLEEVAFLIEGTRLPLSSTAIMFLGMNGTYSDGVLFAVLAMLSRVVWSVYVIRVVASSFSSSISCLCWPTVSVLDRT